MPAGKITALRAQAKDPQRVNVFVDGEFALGISLTTITKTGLHVGKQLSAEEFAKLEQTESGDKAYLAALRFLEARPRSIAEVRARLGRKDFAPEAIDAAIARLAELELLDDAAFARYWVENRVAYRPRGAGALRDELRRKGIDADVTAEVLNDNILAGDESASAWGLARGHCTNMLAHAIATRSLAAWAASCSAVAIPSKSFAQSSISYGLSFQRLRKRKM